MGAPRPGRNGLGATHEGSAVSALACATVLIALGTARRGLE
jgi:hypothetical protein